MCPNCVGLVERLQAPGRLHDIAGMDMVHFGIVLDLITSYYTLGENDATFMKLAEQINKKREKSEE